MDDGNRRRRLHPVNIHIMLILFIIALTLPGVRNQGDRVYFYDARSLSLGGINTPLEMSGNPASLGLTGHFTLLLSGAAIGVNEKRGLRVYDSYGNNIGTSTISNNKSFELHPEACSFIVPLKSFRVAVGYAPLWDFNYSYRREYRDDFYQTTRIVEENHSGSISSLSASLGFVYRFINLGGEVGYLYGTRFREDRVIIPNQADTISRSEDDFNGSMKKLGIIINPNIHLRLAYLYSPAYTVDSPQGVEFKYPEKHILGFFYQPAARVPTKFLAEINYERWEEVLWVYKVGVEHLILNNYAVRYGFCIFPDYTESAVWTTVFSLGAGFKNRWYGIDIGYSYSKKDYTTANYEELGIEEKLRFDETTGIFLLSLSFTF